MPVITCPDCGRDVSTLAAACPHCGRPISPSGFVVPTAMPAAEETLWKGSPSWRVLIGKVVMMVLTVIVIPAAAIFVDTQTAGGGNITKIGWWATALLLLIQLIGLLLAMLRLQSTHYTVTNQRVLIEQGILSKSLSEIDLRSIDDTQFFQSFNERLLGIGNVTLVSSDKALPTTVLRGIHNPRNVRETIRAAAYQVSQRQLFTRAT
jgi:uncharacterized membrane protein YdbT with pleckstrin-like domain